MTIISNRHDDRYVELIDDNTIRKHWKYSLNWLRKHIDILERVIPDRVLSYGVEDYGVYVDLQYVHGIPALDWTVLNEDYMKYVIMFWVNNAKSTFPHVHWDWHLSNTLILQEQHTNITENTSFEMIDWDQCRLATHEEVHDRILHCVTCDFKNYASKDILLEVSKYINETL